ncbi:MAG: hypothetical protein V1743_02730 [Nanoarchaeota archaeon]
MNVDKFLRGVMCAGTAGFLIWASSAFVKPVMVYLMQMEQAVTGQSNAASAEKIEHYMRLSYQQAIAEVKTPEEATWYVMNYIIPRPNWGTNSFRRIHKNRFGDCSEATVAAAALLSDNGYPPTYLYMMNKNRDEGHEVFVYQQNGRWGTIGINSFDNKRPIFASLEDIARYQGYDTYRLGTLGERGMIPDWITTDRDLFYVDVEIARKDLSEFLAVSK